MERDLSEFYKLVSRLRSQSGISLRSASQRAKDLGHEVSHSYIAALETGLDPSTKRPIRRPSYDVIRAIAETYNFPIKELLASAGYSEDGTQEASSIDVREVMTNLDFGVIPVYVTTADGPGSWNTEKPVEVMPVPNSLLKPASYAVRVTVDPHAGLEVRTGDVLLVQRRSDAEDGDVVVEEYSKDENRIVEFNQAAGKIVGVVVRIIRNLKGSVEVE